MKLDHLLEQIRDIDVRIKQEVMEDNGQEQTGDKPELERINAETTVNGLNAVGGCRKCAKTFVNRLELIHHFVDHFPSIFYTFESLTPPTHESTFLEQLAQFLATVKSNPMSANQPKISKSTPPNSLKSNQTQSPTHSDANDSKSNSLSYHMCQHCCLTFAELASFESHMKTHASNAFSSPVFKCEQCQMKCNNLYLLEEHRRLHAKVCYICGEQFDTIFDLNVHVGIHCGNPYSCKDCGQAFASRKALAEHNKTHRIILDAETPPEPKPEVSANKRPHKQSESVSAYLNKEDKPESLLSSNLYFNGLAKNITRRRRVRVLRLKSAASTIANSRLPKEFSKKHEKDH